MDNQYDNTEFFKEYAKMDRSQKGLSAAGEWHQLKPLFPALTGKTVLDLGCGYGAIGIVLKKLYPNSAMTMAEINPRSLELAQENAQRNEVEVRCVHSDVYSGVEGNTFTDIVTNPPIRAGKDVVYRMFDEAYAHLEAGGRLWVVIRKQQGAPSAKKRIHETFQNCEILARSKGYYILFAQKLDKLTVD